ncbi:MAG TPA: thioredoxin-like domain-containing protein [Polyangiaceae bacterium]|nr:thioredoxin-like domain-containing protein [Polyangiaceae bacterium]
MGRLPTLSFALGLALLSLCACDTVPQKDAPMATNERSQAITQKGPATLSSPATIAVKASEPAAPKKPRSLCGGKLTEGRALPKKHVSRAAAKGAPELSESLAVGGGKWTWINFWAAWCAPCKEEIPRLLGFEQKLQATGAFRLSFVSLDDDERQLHDFLDSQPSTGLHASYWLKEGNEREDWLKSVGQNPDAPLPFHLLVDPKGKVRCAIQGAVEDADFAEISGIVSAH